MKKNTPARLSSTSKWHKIAKKKLGPFPLSPRQIACFWSVPPQKKSCPLHPLEPHGTPIGLEFMFHVAHHLAQILAFESCLSSTSTTTTATVLCAGHHDVVAKGSKLFSLVRNHYSSSKPQKHPKSHRNSTSTSAVGKSGHWSNPKKRRKGNVQVPGASTFFGWVVSAMIFSKPWMSS